MFRRLLNLLGIERNGNSREVAHNRLRLVLISDRIGIPPETMRAMKRDLLQVVCRYLEITPSSIDVEVKQTGDAVVLVSSIRVQDLRKASPV